MAHLKLGRPVQGAHVYLPNLKARRLVAGISQDALARRVGATRQALSQWEAQRNRAPRAIVAALAKALRCRASDILAQ